MTIEATSNAGRWTTDHGARELGVTVRTVHLRCYCCQALLPLCYYQYMYLYECILPIVLTVLVLGLNILCSK